MIVRSFMRSIFYFYFVPKWWLFQPHIHFELYTQQRVSVSVVHVVVDVRCLVLSFTCFQYDLSENFGELMYDWLTMWLRTKAKPTDVCVLSKKSLSPSTGHSKQENWENETKYTHKIQLWHKTKSRKKKKYSLKSKHDEEEWVCRTRSYYSIFDENNNDRVWVSKCVSVASECQNEIKKSFHCNRIHWMR